MAEWDYEICPQCDGHGVGGWEARPCGYPGCHRRDLSYVVPVRRMPDPQPRLARAYATEPAPAAAAPRPARAAAERAHERRAAVAILALIGWIVVLVYLGRLGVLAIAAAVVLSLIRVPSGRHRPLAATLLGIVTGGFFSVWLLVSGAPAWLLKGATPRR